MKALEFYQFVGGLSNPALVLGNKYTNAEGRPVPKVAKYIQEVTNLLTFINSKRDTENPFGPDELNELVGHISNLRVAIKDLKGVVSEEEMKKISDPVSEIEQVVVAMDVTTGKPLSKVLDNTVMSYVSTNTVPAQVEGNSSSRNMISIRTGVGDPIEGFFTPEHKLFDESLADEVDLIFRKAIADHPEDKNIKNFYNRLRLTEYGMHTLFTCMNRQYVMGTKPNPILSDFYRQDRLSQYGFLGVFEKIEDFEERKKGITNILMDIRRRYDDKLKELGSNFFQYANREGIGIKAVAGSSKTGRNVAVSNVANILGVPGLIAKAVPITVEINGKQQKGVFAKKASGTDAQSRAMLCKTDFMLCDAHSFDGTILKQMAELQVLDYICQNVDRHAMNILYTIGEDGKINGIQGIDNDLSFGTLKTKNSLTVNWGTALNDITVISESMANRIKSLQPETFASALTGLGLKNEEIQNAWERVMTFRRHLEKNPNTRDGLATGKIKVLRDDEWNNLTLDELSEVRQYRNSRKEILRNMGNLFSRIRTLVNMIFGEKERHYANDTEQYRAAKQAGFPNPNEINVAPQNANEENAFTIVDYKNPFTTKNFDAYKAFFSDKQDVMNDAGDELKNDDSFKAMQKALKTINEFKYSDLNQPNNLLDQHKARWNFRVCLLDIIDSVKSFLDKFSGKAADASVREQYESAMQLYKDTVQKEEIIYEADMRQQEEELDEVHLELIAEQHQFENIVQTIVDNLAEKMKDEYPREAVEEAVMYGPALKAMMDDQDLMNTLGKKNYIATYSTMAERNPEELVGLYVEHLQKADKNTIHENAINAKIVADPGKFGFAPEVIGKEGLYKEEIIAVNNNELISSTDEFKKLYSMMTACLPFSLKKLMQGEYYHEEKKDVLATYVRRRSIVDALDKIRNQPLSTENVDIVKDLQLKSTEKNKKYFENPDFSKLLESCAAPFWGSELKEEDIITMYDNYASNVNEKKITCKEDPTFQDIKMSVKNTIGECVRKIEETRTKGIKKADIAKIVVEYEKLDILNKMDDRLSTNSILEKAQKLADNYDDDLADKVNLRAEEIERNTAFKRSVDVCLKGTREFTEDLMEKIYHTFTNGGMTVEEIKAAEEAKLAEDSVNLSAVQNNMP